MPAYKNKENGSWYVVTQYTDWTGERKPKCKRGFATRREALEWEQKFQQQSAGDLDMSFEAFCEIYTNDLKARLKESTWQTKENIIKTKLLPYFGKRKINEITTKDVIAWQNELLAYRDEKRKPYSQTYLKTLHNQLSAIFNHAVRFYDLHSNPAAKAGNMGTEERREMMFWTKEEYQKFAEEMMDKPVSYYAFQMLYWTGIREGELLALTPADFDFERGTVKISKTYQRLKGQDVIAEIMLEHGIEWEQKGEHKEHLSVLEFKREKRKEELAELEQSIERVQQQQVCIQAVEQIEAKPLPLTSKVAVDREDYQNLVTAAQKYIAQEKQEGKLKKLLKEAKKTISDLKAKIQSLTAELSAVKAELAQYKSVRGKLRTADLEQENSRLRSKIRSYESAIERNDLWHIFNPHRNKTRNRDDAR